MTERSVEIDSMGVEVGEEVVYDISVVCVRECLQAETLKGAVSGDLGVSFE